MQENKSIWYNGMIYGAYLGVSLIVLSLLFNSLKIETPRLSTLLTLVIMIVWIIIGTKSFRNSLGGYITYSGALGTSVVIILFAGVISAFFTYLFLTVIEPDTIANSIVEMENVMIEKGDDEETITNAIRIYKKFASPGFFAFFAFMGNLLMGFLISLITSLFMKRKNPNPFSGVEDSQVIDSDIQ